MRICLVAVALLVFAGCGGDNTASVPESYQNSQRSADQPKQLMDQGTGGEQETQADVPPPVPPL